jgi:hypothetical protein
VYVDVIAELRNEQFTWRGADNVTHTYPVENAWSHGQKGYGITVEGGGVWYVKKTGSGCGGCGK